MSERAGLVLTDEFPPFPGGIGMHAYQLALNFTRMGIPVLVATTTSRRGFTYRPTAEFDHEQPFPIHRIFSRRPLFGQNILNIIDVLKICNTHKVSWIICCTPYSGILAITCKYLQGIPYFLPGYGSEFLRTSWWKRFILRNAAQHFAISNYTAFLMENAAGRPPLVIFIGADQHEYNPELVSEEIILKLRSDYCISGSPLLVSVGRLNERKGHHVTLEALKSIRTQFPNVQLVIVGRSVINAQEYEAKIHSFLAEAGLVENVCFIPSLLIDELRALYAMADISILSSMPGANQVEGFGIVLIEANLMGKPVVAARSGGMIDAVEDGISGFLYTPGDADDLAQKVMALLSDQELREKIGHDGQERARRSFVWEIVAEKTWEAMQAHLTR